MTKQVGRLKSELETEREEHKRVVADLIQERDGYKEDAINKHEKGFERALDQVRVLYPELDLFEAHFLRDIVDGKLVD